MARPNHDDKHLAVLQDYYAEHRLIPSYSAISALLGFSAKTAAAALVKRLEDAGYLRRTPDRRLSPTERFFERPRSVASVRAGMPEVAMDTSADMVTIDSLLVHKPSQTFFVPIKGDSMCEVGLLEGDTAVCERRQQARPGEIVVAVVNDELTIKTLMLETSLMQEELMQEALMQEGHRQEALMQEERTEEPRPNKLMGQTGAQEKSSQAKLSQKNRSGGKPGKQGQRLVLKPENPNYPILRPDPLEIIGVVTGSFRSYRR